MNLEFACSRGCGDADEGALTVLLEAFALSLSDMNVHLDGR